MGLLTQLRADTPLPILFAWMFIVGLGIGSMFSVFAIVVQNSVAVTQIGAASSNLSFFQQVGGTVGLAITGTVFASTMTREVPTELSAAGVPPEVGQALASSGGTQALTGVGDAGAALLAALPADVRGLVEPHIPAIVEAIHSALSLAIASTSGRDRGRSSPRGWSSCSATLPRSWRRPMPRRRRERRNAPSPDA